MQKWNLLQASTEFGCSREKLRLRLRKTGVTSSEFTTKQILAALYTPEDVARAEKLVVEAELLRLEQAERTEELISLTAVGEKITQWLVLPLGNALNTLPTTLDTRCNPENPTLAREALEAWVEGVKKILRDGMPMEPKNQ